MIKLDMHVHTKYSADSALKIGRISDFLKKNTNFALCITDHNEIDGAKELNRLFSERIIVGEEIRTAQGEVIGLFLQEKIEPGMSVDDTCDAIRQQGGLIYIPHPLDRLRTSKLTPEGLQTAVERCDIIEVFNSRNVFMADDAAALELAQKVGRLKACGSDAHTAMELGRSYVELPKLEDGAVDFLNRLPDGHLIKRRSFIGVHFVTKYRKIIAKI